MTGTKLLQVLVPVALFVLVVMGKLDVDTFVALVAVYLVPSPVQPASVVKVRQEGSDLP